MDAHVHSKYYTICSYTQANDVVFEVLVDSLPEDTVVNYTINYEFYNVLMHQNMVIPDSAAGADTTSTAPGTLYSLIIRTQDTYTMLGTLRITTRYTSLRITE